MVFRKSALTIYFLIAFLFGVAMGEFFNFSWQWLVVLAIVDLAIAIFGKNFVRLVGLVIFGIVLGWMRFLFSLHQVVPQTLDFYNGSRVEAVGTVCAEVDRRGTYTKYTLCISETDSQEVEGRVLIKTNSFPEFSYGDELKISGELETPFETEEFSYRDYLKRFEIYSTMSYPRIEKIGTGEGNFLLAELFAFKKTLEARINRIFVEPQASFMSGLLIGSRRGIPEDVLEDFNTVGLTHIIAISGYNISLVIAFITALFGSYVPRKLQFPIAFIFVCTFTVLVGGGAAVTRAAIMGLLAFYALTHGKQYHVGVALALTASAMVAWNPQILLHDVSFQLSFAAVAGLLFVSPILEKYFQKIPNKFAIRESLLLTLSAQVFALPLIVFYFGRLSLVSPLANVLAAPAIPLSMLLGFIALILSIVSLPLAIFVGFFAHGLLSFILFIANRLALLPFASIDVGDLGIVFVVVYYCAVVGFLIRKNFLKKQNEFSS